MRILLLHDKGTATGGAEYQILSLRDDLRARGHDARLFASTATTVPGSPFLADYRCFGTSSERFQVLTQTANPSAYLALRRVLAEFRPDVVHLRLFLWQLSPLVLPLLRDLPVVYQTSMYKAVCPKGTKVLPSGRTCDERAGRPCLAHSCVTPQTWAVLMAQIALFRRWRGAIDHVAALSEEMAGILSAEGLSPVSIIYNGVAERPARPPLSGAPTAAYAGRLVREKGVHVLLAAFAAALRRVPGARLLIAGQGPEEPALRRQADGLGIGPAVRFLGHLPREAMEDALGAAWVQCVPGLWPEPFGNVVTEAMMRGTAVIASEAGGMRDTVADGRTGHLVPPGAAGPLAERLETLLADRALSERLGAAGRERALSTFSERARTDGFVELYERLTALPRYARRGAEAVAARPI